MWVNKGTVLVDKIWKLTQPLRQHRKCILVLSNFTPIIPSGLTCQVWANFLEMNLKRPHSSKKE